MIIIVFSFFNINTFIILLFDVTQVSTEASSFLDKRCRSRGQSLSTVIPQGSPQAIQLINKLLAVDPVIRPTAHQALTFDYLKDAEILCDYEKQYLQRPPSTLFDFESEKYSLEQLKELIVGEVRLSAVSNQELRAKLGMPEEEPLPIETIKKIEEVIPTAVINHPAPSDIPAVARGTISFNAVTNATAFAQAAAVAAQAAAATTQRRMSSSNNDIKASVGANGNKYDFHNGPRDNEGRSLRRTSASEPSNSNHQNNVVNNTKTIDSSTTLNEQYLAREAQMDTNTTQRANIGSKILFSSSSNNTTTPSNIAAIARDVDAVKIAKSTTTTSSTTTTNSNTASRRLSEGNSLRQASTSEKADRVSQRSSTGGMQSERTSERTSGSVNGNVTAETPQTAPYGHVLSTISRGPKTPSPRKMDVIMAKGAKAKKQSLESGANEDRNDDKIQATASSDALTAANIDNNSNGGNTNSSSSFLKNRHFGFMRSATTSSSRPISANENSNSNSNSNNSSVRSADGQGGQTAGLSSLLSQFSGRYQSLSSRAKSAAGTGPAAAVDRSGELITKPVALKPVRTIASTVPQATV